MLEEVSLYLEELYKDKGELDEKLLENKEKLKELSGDNLKERYIEERKEYIMDDMRDNWATELVEEIGLSIDEAIAQGAIDIDEEEAIDGAINMDGLGHTLATYDGHTAKEDNFYFFRTN